LLLLTQTSKTFIGQKFQGVTTVVEISCRVLDRELVNFSVENIILYDSFELRATCCFQIRIRDGIATNLEQLEKDSCSLDVSI